MDQLFRLSRWLAVYLLSRSPSDEGVSVDCLILHDVANKNEANRSLERMQLAFCFLWGPVSAFRVE